MRWRAGRVVAAAAAAARAANATPKDVQDQTEFTYDLFTLEMHTCPPRQVDMCERRKRATPPGPPALALKTPRVAFYLFIYEPTRDKTENQTTRITREREGFIQRSGSGPLYRCPAPAGGAVLRGLRCQLTVR